MFHKGHSEILSTKQVELLPLVKKFMMGFGLVGGTAIALHIGHRRSIDFDLFSTEEFKNGKIKNIVTRSDWEIERTLRDEDGQFTFFINKVQMTFFHYPFEIDFTEDFDGIRAPDLITLAAMKAYALGRRAKWKDYIDLFFIIEKHYSIEEIAAKSQEIFKNEFNERLFRQQLAYFGDVNYEEEVEFLPGFEVDEETVKKKLIDFSLE